MSPAEIDRSTSIRGALRSRQRGFIINPFRFGDSPPPGPTDPDFASVVSLVHFDGANGSTTFTDQKGKTWTASGAAALTTAQQKFGSASLGLNGTNAYATTPGASGVSVAGDVTVEGWLRPASGTANMAAFTVYSNTSNRITVGVRDSDLGLYLFTSSTSGGAAVRISSGAATVATDTWHHVAVTKSSGTWSLFLNGTLAGTSTTTSFPSSTSLAIAIGSGAVGDALFSGQIDEFRMTVGVARYTSSFTSPTEAFPNS